MDRIEEIRARIKRASRGPWKDLNANRGVVIQGQDEPVVHVNSGTDDSGHSNIKYGNLEFITNAREDIPYLLTALAEKDDEITHHLLVLGESAKSEAEKDKRIEELEILITGHEPTSVEMAYDLLTDERDKCLVEIDGMKRELADRGQDHAKLLDRLEHRERELQAYTYSNIDEKTALESKITLLEAVVKLGWHAPGCLARDNDGPCSGCRYGDALAALGKEGS